MENAMHLKQMLADVQVLMTLSFLAGLVICGGVAIVSGLLTKLRVAARRGSSGDVRTAKWALLAGSIIVASYGAMLAGTSLASREMTLSPGQEKYFCEVDCHLAYSVTGVTASKTIGGGASAVTGPGTFYVVTIRTRFDEKTISPHRGDSLLQPPGRRVTLVDADGRQYEASPEGQRALVAGHQNGEALTTPLRPGESYFTRLAFNLPPDVRKPQILLESPAQPRWMGWIALGDEESFLHKKVYLQLPAAASGKAPSNILALE
jgi:hypothetical protein